MIHNEGNLSQRTIGPLSEFYQSSFQQRSFYNLSFLIGSFLPPIEEGGSYVSIYLPVTSVKADSADMIPRLISIINYRCRHIKLHN